MAYKKGHSGYWKDKGCGPWSSKKRPEVSTWLKQFPKGFIPWNKGKTKEEYPQLSVNKGEANGMWRGGMTSRRNKQLAWRIRRSFKYRQWRSDIFTRDDFTCQECGRRGGILLRAHHIESFALIMELNDIKTFEQAMVCEELWNINNGETLCKKCHEKTKQGRPLKSIGV